MFLFSSMFHGHNFRLTLIRITEKFGNDASLTGAAYDFGNATSSLTQKSLFTPKKVTLVRHGLSTWNEEGRVQVCWL